LLINIIDNKVIQISQITPAEEDVLVKELSVRHPRANYVDTTAGCFDGWYRKYNIRTKRVARPLLGELRAICKRNRLPLKVLDSRPPPQYPAPSVDIATDLLPGITLYQYQIDALHAMCRAEVGCVSAPTGSGKCFGADVMVMMFDGSSKPASLIKKGDILMGDDSTPRKVLATHCGNGKLYRIEQKNGNHYIVNEFHTLSLKRTNDGTNLAGSIIDIDLDQYQCKSKTFKHIHKSYKAPATFKYRNVLVDPYFLGLWLGDGRHDAVSITVNNNDKEIIDFLENYASINQMVITEHNRKENCTDLAVCLYKGIHAPNDYKPFTQNPIKAEFKNLGVWKNKHVPDLYKYNSRDVQLKILAGFIDADGYVVRHKGVDITHKKGKLIDNIVFIARSLGFRVSEHYVIKTCTTSGYSNEYKRISISGDLTDIPTLLERKKFHRPKNKKDPLVCGISIIPTGDGDFYGFETDGNKRFLLDDFTVAHNSEMIAGITKLMDCPTVVIAESIVVLEQLKERLELREVVEEAGLFCAGKRPNGQRVIVGSIQSLSSPSKPPQRTKKDTTESHLRKTKAFRTRYKNARMLRKLVAECDMLIIDEVDRSSASNYKNLFKFWFNGRRRFGFSGTIYDPDKPVENITLKENMGSVIYSISRKAVEKVGRIVPVTYNALVMGDPAGRTDKSTFDIATREWMIENDKFHYVVKALALKTTKKEGHGTLILVQSLELGYKLEEMIPGSKFICGDHKPTERNEAINAFEMREMPILIGSKILQRGLDLDGGCESLIIATGGKLESNFDQKVGRALRKNKIGKSTIYDFYFLCNFYLYSHSRRRLKTLVAMDYPAKVIFKNGSIEGTKFIKSRFRIPKGFI
jgi:superfamily II DNA or RNA helicase